MPPRHRLPDGRQLASWRAGEVGEKRFQQLSVNARGDTVYAMTPSYSVWALDVAEGTIEKVFDDGDLLPGARLRAAILVPYQDRLVIQQGSVRDNRTAPESSIHDLTTRQRVVSLDLPNSFFRSSQDGRWIMCPLGSDAGPLSAEVGVWDSQTGLLQQMISTSRSYGPAGVVLASGADERFVILPRYNPAELRLWDLQRATWTLSCRGPVSLWHRAKLSADRSLMLAVARNVAGGQTQYKILKWNLPP